MKATSGERVWWWPAVMVAALLGCGACSSASAPSSAPATTPIPTAPAPETLPPATTLVTAPPAPTSTAAPPAPPSIYADAGPGQVQPRLAADPPRVYVPNSGSNTVSVIDPQTFAVLDTFATPRQPQHIVPSYDLTTLWVLDNQSAALTPIDPASGAVGTSVAVDDPYNLYFTVDGSTAIVVAEAQARLDFRDPVTMDFVGSLAVPECAGLNHADFSADGRYLIATCEFAGRVVKIDLLERSVEGVLDLVPPAADDPAATTFTCTIPSGQPVSTMPQDIRTAPDGRHFYVADMLAGGVHVIDGDELTEIGFIPTGLGAHGITPSRDGSELFVANRGATTIAGAPHGPGSVSVIDIPHNTVVATWRLPDGGSPDMGSLNADGTQLWLSGRYDSEVYVFDTAAGALMARIAVGNGPHGLTVWPQPGRFSLGHTGTMR